MNKNYNFVFDILRIFLNVEPNMKEDFLNDFLGGMVLENEDIIKVITSKDHLKSFERDFGIHCLNVFDLSEDLTSFNSRNKHL